MEMGTVYNVQDERQSGAIRFDIKKNDGTILYSNVDTAGY